MSVYDVRSYSSSRAPVARFRTHYAPSSSMRGGGGGMSGAARVCKYSPGSSELLAFSEQRGYVHVVDARTYEYKQSVHIADQEVALASAPASAGATGSEEDVVLRRTRRLAARPAPQSGPGRREAQTRMQEILAQLPALPPGLQHPGAASISISGSRAVNPWDTFNTDDFSSSPAFMGRPPAAAVAIGDDEELDFEEEDEDGMYHRQILQAAIAAEAELDGGGRRWGALQAQAQALPVPDEEEWCPVLPPDSNADPRVPARRSGADHYLSNPTPSWASPAGPLSSATRFTSGGGGSPLTVSRLLASLPSGSGAIPDLTASAAAGVNGISLTGLDWDPTGRYLYASMERVVLEWEVNESGRRCAPSRGML